MGRDGREGEGEFGIMELFIGERYLLETSVHGTKGPGDPQDAGPPGRQGMKVMVKESSKCLSLRGWGEGGAHPKGHPSFLTTDPV